MILEVMNHIKNMKLIMILFTVKPWAKKGKDKDKDTTAEDEPSNIKTDKPIGNNDDKSSEKSDIIQDKDNEESDKKQEKEKESDEETTSEPEPEETYIIVENPKIKRKYL